MTTESDHCTAVLQLRVHPNAAKNKVIDFNSGVLWVRIAAPPVKGKANKELVAFLSKTLGLSKGSLNITKGHASHNKVMAIAGLSQEEVVTELTSKLSSSCDDATSKIYRRQLSRQD